MKSIYYNALILTTAMTTPAIAQTAPAGDAPGDIIVTARRTEERLQDVPISITVFNQQQLNNKNLVGATALATYTPSLSTNNNFGNDNATFAIRGFAQDIGTAPSVGVYFGDVVKPRGGSNGQPVGDNAGPGDFFDLQNVQVLKGPQGTLFGRNTTGGAVLFVPQRPTDKYEGYVEGSFGNYNMYRTQAVINIPVNDTFLVRAAFDHMQRNGYLNNISGYGPKHFNDTDYYAGRVSVVANLTPDLENYTIVSYTDSKNNGALSKLVAADATQGSGIFGPLAAAQLARQNATRDFYAVESTAANANLHTEQWQIINKTTWRASDTLTIRNIASYAQLKQRGVNPIFGTRFVVPTIAGNYNVDFAVANSKFGGNTANEATITDEFRLEGQNGRLNWQAGAYFESAQPLGQVGSQSPTFAACQNNDFSNYQCSDPLRLLIAQGVAAQFGLPAAAAGQLAALVPAIGSGNTTLARTRFRDIGLYAQGTYSILDNVKVTGGIRYTWDRQSIDTVQINNSFAIPPAYGVTGQACFQQVLVTFPQCETRFRTRSDAPTWLIDVDYNPIQNLLLYAKYSRGYRAATIAPNIPIGGTAADPDYTLNYIRQEKVDAYEAGLKSSFGGSLHGTFNFAGFYNKFDNQQLQVGFRPKPGLEGRYPQTAAPVNAGKSTIYGGEVEASLRPFTGLSLDAGYTYLHTKIKSVLPLPTNPAYNTDTSFQPGDPEVLSPKHKFIVGANYTLPFDASVGKITVGGTVTYRSSFLSNYIDRANPNPAIASLSRIPSLTLVDLALNWTNVGGSPFDIGAFVTNLTKRKYYTFSAGLGSTQLGLETESVGEPRFFGGRIRYHFGN